MKRNQTKQIIFSGVLCALFMAAASWYAISFNDSRLVAPMDFSEYTFRIQDLPMIASGAFFALYILYLFYLLVKTILTKKRREAAGECDRTRMVNPKLGFLGFLGFAGFLGFVTYSMNKTIFPFIFFMFFGFFGFFYEGKMSDVFMDERYKENKMKAHMTANKIALSVIFLAVLLLGQGKFMGNLEYTLIALIIIISIAMALEVFLSEYLLYRYDHEESFEESGE